MREVFVRLIRELGPLLDAEPPLMAEGEPEAVHLRLDGIDFMMAHRLMPRGMLSICCNFGPLPEPPPAAELLRLLEINLTLGAAGAGTLGVDGWTRDVIYLFHVPLQGLSAHLLFEALSEAIRQAHAWRKGTPPLAAPAAPASAMAPPMPLPDTLA